MKATQKLHEVGQSLWVDNITRKMLRDDVLDLRKDLVLEHRVIADPSIQRADASNRCVEILE